MRGSRTRSGASIARLSHDTAVHESTASCGLKRLLPGNRLKDRSTPTRPNEVWVGDITYIPTKEGWLNLAAIMDRCTRKITGHSVATHMEESLVREAPIGAVERYTPEEGLLHHTDRGCQYTSKAMRE